MKESICNFIPYRNDYHSLHTINFVLERKHLQYNGIFSYSTYKIHYVLKGNGILHLTNKSIKLTVGDIFFTFPGIPYGIEPDEDFEYMYITFVGTKATIILEKLGINKNKFLFSDCSEILGTWEKGIELNNEISDLMIESILLYTFYYLGNKLMILQKNSNKSNTLALKIKKYIDDNYADNRLSLETLSKNLSYTPKYISTTFKKTFNFSISNYITTLRVQHACTLMNLGFTSISDIANQCGYSDSQYFSKVFRKAIGKSPKDYINNPKF